MILQRPDGDVGAPVPHLSDHAAPGVVLLYYAPALIRRVSHDVLKVEDFPTKLLTIIIATRFLDSIVSNNWFQ